MLVERNRSVQEARKDPGKSRQNVFSNLQVRKPSELQTSVSVRRSRLRHLSLLRICYCSEFVPVWKGGVPVWKSLFRASMAATTYVPVCQAFFLSRPFYECVSSMLNSHWQKLLQVMANLKLSF